VLAVLATTLFCAVLSRANPAIRAVAFIVTVIATVHQAITTRM
jgi:hypothetical protein